MASFSWNKIHSIILLVCALVGLLASFALTYDTFKVAADASYDPACSINPILSCVSVMESDSGALIGSIPNSMFGIVAFSALAAFATLLLFGTTVSKRVWQLAAIAASAGFIFIHFLIYESVFQIKSLCPWCMVTWLVVTPIFFLVAAKYASLSTTLAKDTKSFIQRNYIALGAVWYFVVILVILIEFWSYWKTLLP